MYGIGTVVTLVAGTLLAGCSGQAGNAAAIHANPEARENFMINRDKPSGAVRPHRGLATTADPRDFDSLDDYLAQLERLGATGQAWYRETSPGHYEFVTTMVPAPARRTFTRAELMTRFGFSR